MFVVLLLHNQVYRVCDVAEYKEYTLHPIDDSFAVEETDNPQEYAGGNQGEEVGIVDIA